MARGTSRLTGFREAARQLNDMKRSAAQGVGRRSLLFPAEILALEMQNRVSVLSGATRDSIAVGKEKARRGRPQVNVTAADIASIQLEFGNSDMVAEPFARPAKEAKQDVMLESFGEALKREVDKTVIRSAKKAGKG
ncbi:hypothetical protein [Sphingobium sp. MI1205]|uniref:hypothetical protein n=1 Tax=Sphingobium sp. MI1205 TaxID=407020 RepID=UPI0007705DD2|nr:hypothetical protein [Sphingobium sp. MI1205]AMK19334.1 hypothetical protein K663_14780 [Sphingobium sp. MI1205]